MSNVRKNILEKEGKNSVTTPIMSVGLVITLNKNPHHCWNYFVIIIIVSGPFDNEVISGPKKQKQQHVNT